MAIHYDENLYKTWTMSPPLEKSIFVSQFLSGIKFKGGKAGPDKLGRWLSGRVLELPCGCARSRRDVASGGRKSTTGELMTLMCAACGRQRPVPVSSHWSVTLVAACRWRPL